MWEREAKGCLLRVSGHSSSSLPLAVLWAPTPGASRVAGRQARKLGLAQPTGSFLNAVCDTAGQSGGLHSVGKGLRRHLDKSGEEISLSSSLSDHASALRLSSFSIPHPEAEWSPGQSTKWLFATKHLEKPEGGAWPFCQSRLPHSHTVTHTALRRLCQQAWPNWAQLLSLHLHRVKGANPWLLQKQAEGGEAGHGRVSQARRKKWEEGRQGLSRPLSRPDGCPWK